MKKILFILLSLFLWSCKSKHVVDDDFMRQSFQKVSYFDEARNRQIPVAIFRKDNFENQKMLVVIFSHGYRRNQADSYLEYSYLVERLALKGYFVASIQHELPTDELLPLEGNPQVLRRPNWERGSENILFVLNQLKKDYPKVDYSKVIVAGHSNGGDMTVLFTEKHPEMVWKLITLDQRRYSFPRISRPQIYSLRSSDQPADTGVLPTLKEQKKLGITIIKLPKTIHNDMDDSGTDQQKREIADYFMKFLNEN